MNSKKLINRFLQKESSGFLKDASPIPKGIQLENQLKQFLAKNLSDSYGSLKAILSQRIDQNAPLIAENSNDPLKALLIIIENILKHDQNLYELVRQVDQHYGMSYQERPHFQKPGQKAHPEDVYTHESVKNSLLQIKKALQ